MPESTKLLDVEERPVKIDFPKIGYLDASTLDGPLDYVMLTLAFRDGYTRRYVLHGKEGRQLEKEWKNRHLKETL